MICIDASIIIRLLTQAGETPFNQQWEQWRKEGESFVAPTLLHYEICNGLYKYQKVGWLTPDVVAAQQAYALAMPIQLVGTAALHQRALRIAADYTLPATYDAHYIAVSEQFNCPFWTADAKLLRLAQPFTDQVQLLK